MWCLYRRVSAHSTVCCGWSPYRGTLTKPSTPHHTSTASEAAHLCSLWTNIALIFQAKNPTVPVRDFNSWKANIKANFIKTFKSRNHSLWVTNIKFSLTQAVLQQLIINTFSKCFFGVTGQENCQLSYPTCHTRRTTSRYCMLPGPRHRAMLEAVCNFKTLAFHNMLLSP